MLIFVHQVRKNNQFNKLLINFLPKYFSLNGLKGIIRLLYRNK